MPVYECTEDEFLENLAKIAKNVADVTVHKRVQEVEERYGLRSYDVHPPNFPDKITAEINKLVEMNRENHVQLIGDTGHLSGDWQLFLSIPVVYIEHSFTWAGCTYVHRFSLYPNYQLHQLPTTQEVYVPCFWEKFWEGKGTQRKIVRNLIFEVLELDRSLADLPLPNNVQVLGGRLAAETRTRQ